MLVSYRGSRQAALSSFNYMRPLNVNLRFWSCELRLHCNNKSCYQGYRYYTQTALEDDDDFVDIDAGIAPSSTARCSTPHEMSLTSASQDMLGVIRAPELPANLRYSRLRLPLTSEAKQERFVRPNSRSYKHVSQQTEKAEVNDSEQYEVANEMNDFKKSSKSHTANNEERNKWQVSGMNEILQKINSGYRSNNNVKDDVTISCDGVVGDVNEESVQNVAMTTWHTLQNESNDAKIGHKQLSEKLQNNDDEFCEERMKKPGNNCDDSINEICNIHAENEEEQQLRHYRYSQMKDDALPYDDEKFAETILEMEVEGAIDEAWQDARKAELTDVKEITEVLKQMKVRDICCIDVSAKTGSFDYIIFATCEGARHIHLSAWAVQEADSFHRVSKIRRRQSDETWEVVPVGRILVNLMLESTRLKLMLERKWAVTSFMDPLKAANAPISEGRNVKSHGLWTLTLNLQDLKDFEVDYCKDILLGQL